MRPTLERVAGRERVIQPLPWTGGSVDRFVLGDRGNRYRDPPVAGSTKPLVGHTLGAAGAIEAAFCWLVLTKSDARALALPPHWWDSEQDPELPALHLVRKGETAALRSAPRVMSNSFGFGGNNCTLVLGRDA